MDTFSNNEMTVEEEEYIEPSSHKAPEISEPNFIGDLKIDNSKTGEDIIREALMWLPRDPDAKVNTRINEEKPLDIYNDSENKENSSGIIVNNKVQEEENEGNDKEEKEDERENGEDLYDLIKEFNDLELAKPNVKPGNIKHMMKDAEKNPLDGVLDMPENENEDENENNIKVKVKDDDEESSEEESEEDEEEHGGLYAFLDPKPEKEPEDDEAKFKRIKD